MPADVYETKVRGRQSQSERPATRVTRRDIEERLPRSAPDALRYEPGVYVQQTAHSQGSAIIRGRTGQQTVILFDGIRLNNSTFRQGPNQYFFTIDAHTVRVIEVQRGGASTLFGSDAIGGTIDAKPIEPRIDRSADSVRVSPGLAMRYGSADGEVGGRLQVDLQPAKRLGFVGGMGYRRVGKLRAGGRLDTPARGNTPAGGWVPRFDEDGETQLGTGFWELTSDARAVLELRPDLRLVAAYYGYYQTKAPRTDKCPPAEAPIDSCLTYDEQFRTLAYLALQGAAGPLARRLRIGTSFQNQHERRLDDRPASMVENGGRDDVYTVGLTAKLETTAWSPTRWAELSLRYGGDLYHDQLDSTAWTRFTDLQQVIVRSRGQYIDGSHYTGGGLYLQPSAKLLQDLTIEAGARLSLASARADADEESDTRQVSRTWTSVVGHVGVAWRALPWLTFIAGLDRSFRAPNLDDLTSRQATGPGFQVENPDLVPENGLTVEGAVRLTLPWLQAEAWAYWAQLDDAIERRPLPLEACPQTTGRSCLQLVNLGPQGAVIRGVEGIARLMLPKRITLRATIAWARGDGPNPVDPGAADVPLSRVPPLNGTVELRWRHRSGFYAGASLRWAAEQQRLSLGDEADARIPPGGTPGFAVFDLRTGFRFRRQLLVALVLENVGDTAYRYHGSSVNGPGRSVILSVEGNM